MCRETGAPCATMPVRARCGSPAMGTGRRSPGRSPPIRAPGGGGVLHAARQTVVVAAAAAAEPSRGRRGRRRPPKGNDGGPIGCRRRRWRCGGSNAGVSGRRRAPRRGGRARPKNGERFIVIIQGNLQNTIVGPVGSCRFARRSGRVPRRFARRRRRWREPSSPEPERKRELGPKAEKDPTGPNVEGTPVRGLPGRVRRWSYGAGRTRPASGRGRRAATGRATDDS